MREEFNHIDELLGKYFSGECTPEEIAQVNAWAEEREENRKYKDQMQFIFDRAASVKVLQQFDTDEAWRKLKGNLKNNNNGRVIPLGQQDNFPLKWMWRVAAGFILLAGVAFYFLSQKPGTVNQPIQVVAEQKALGDTLPDGTAVFLNKKTTLQYAYEKKSKTHRIKLDGEAYFNVQHAGDETLIIETNGVFIKDIGTSFNVKAYPDQPLVEVLVEEGEIVFYSKEDPGIRLRESGKAIYDKRTKSFSIDQPDPNVVAYKTKFFVFSSTDLNTVVQSINQVYDEKIVLPDHLRKCALTVSFKNEEVEEMANVIAETLGLSVVKKANQFFLEGEGCE